MTTCGRVRVHQPLTSTVHDPAQLRAIRPLGAFPEPSLPMTQPPVSFSTPRPGLRETSLLLIGAGFASLMFDLPALAIVCGTLALTVWMTAMARGPRPSWRVAAAIGAGLVLMYMWWPAESDTWAAIALLWIGVALVLAACAWALVSRNRSRQQAA